MKKKQKKKVLKKKRNVKKKIPKPIKKPPNKPLISPVHGMEINAEKMERFAFAVKLLEGRVLDNEGNLRVVPAHVYHNFHPIAVRIFCWKHGLYSLPTEELVNWLRDHIRGEAIEIGAGNGALSRALGIKATDAKYMDNPDMALLYEMARQPRTTYGSNVEKLNAAAAIEKYKPDTVIACWVTQLYQPGDEEEQIGSRVGGVDELAILKNVKNYILVGHDVVHARKRIFEFNHHHIVEPWIISRTMDHPEQNFIKVFGEQV